MGFKKAKLLNPDFEKAQKIKLLKDNFNNIIAFDEGKNQNFSLELPTS